MMHLVGDLLTELEALDFIGALLAPYVDTLGPISWGFFALIFLLPLQGRLGTTPLVVLSIFLWGPLLYVAPANLFKIGGVLLQLALGLALAYLVLGVVLRDG